MVNKKVARLRRARKTRAKISELKAVRLTVHRSNQHIYAQILSECGSKVIASASTAEKGQRSETPNGGNVAAASIVGRRIAERARALGVDAVSFDRAGFHYHGRVKALAEAAREAGLKF